MRFLTTSCKKATYLLSKKEEKRLSLLEKIQMRSHLTICSFCRKFEQQAGFITRNARHLHTHSGETLSLEAKTRIQKALKN